MLIQGEIRVSWSGEEDLGWVAGRHNVGKIINETRGPEGRNGRVPFVTCPQAPQVKDQSLSLPLDFSKVTASRWLLVPSGICPISDQRHFLPPAPSHYSDITCVRESQKIRCLETSYQPSVPAKQVLKGWALGTSLVVQ